MYIGINIIKSHAMSCLNRDEDGMPKTCVFGAEKRARISTQNQKYTIRHADVFADLAAEIGVGTRTRHLSNLVSEELGNRAFEENKLNALIHAMDASYAKLDEEKTIRNFTAYEIKMLADKIENWSKDKSAEEIEATVAKLLAASENKKGGSKKKNEELSEDVEAMLKAFSTDGVYGTMGSLDIALFGRMVTSGSNEGRSTEAAVCMSHAMSTHAAAIQNDFFTAVDEVIDDCGAAHMNNTAYDSACYYQFMAIDTNQLMENLAFIDDPEKRKEIAVKAVKALLMCAAGMSSASRQHSFASMPFPAAIMVEMRENTANFSYANAYEKPVKADVDGGYIEPSVIALRDLAEKTEKMFECFAPEKRLWLTTQDGVKFDSACTINCASFGEMLDNIKF